MKNLKIFSTLFFLITTLAGCKKDLDINNDPSLVENASLQLLLPSGISYSAGTIGGDYHLIGSLWSQHYTQNNTSSQYGIEDSYALVNTDYNRGWNNLWASGIKDLNNTMILATESGQWNYYVAAAIMKAFDFHVLADMYGAIPIDESLQGEANTRPVYTEGKDINTKIIAILDDAISKEAAAKALPSIGSPDYIFEGDIENWIKFAKTLKLKLLLRDPSVNLSAIQTMLNAGGFLDLDAKMDVFEDKENYSNPLYENDKRKLNTDVNLKASNTLLNFLKSNNDPRISDFFYVNGSGVYAGLEQGTFDIPSTTLPTDATSVAIIEPTDPVYLLSAAESKFLQAEAWARLNNTANAKLNYDAGVTLAFTRWGKNAAPFIAPGGEYQFQSGSFEAMLESIITQKWVAAVRSQAWDSFFDQNRTGYPEVSSETATTDPGYEEGEYIISDNTSLNPGELPRRLPFPKSSSDYNPNTPAVVSNDTKMWWHK
ncbi:MAG: SusD/RagB family nutrient-binding outer membrane lipoprotein [Sphingobacteriaceae bacterium]